MIRVALFCDQMRFQHDVTNLLMREGLIVLGCIDRPEDTAAKLAGWTPEAIVLFDPFGADAGRLLQSIRQRFPGVAIIVVAKSGDPGHVRHFFRLGADDVVPTPRDLAMLPGTIREVRNRQSHAGGGRTGQVVAVWSPKGGVGCSLLAANLAAALQADHRRRSLLVDLTGPYGGAHVLLGLKPERTLSDLFRVMGDLSPTHLRQAVTEHQSGLAVLCGSTLLEPMGGLQPEYLRSLIGLAKTLYDVVILDVPSTWTAPVQTAIDLADRLLIVVTPDAPAVRTVQVAARALPLAKRQRMVVGLVVNRVSNRAELQAQEIEKVVGLPLIGAIRSDFTALEPLVNTGQSLVGIKASQGRPGKVSQDVATLAQRLA